MSLLLTLCMILSMVTTSVFADTTDSITVNVSIAQNGEIVTGIDEMKIAHTPITVTDHNEDGCYDIDEVLYAVHELYYDGGGESGYASEVTQYGLSLTKLWGDDSGAFGYYKNNQTAMSLADTIENGDSLYAFVYQDKTYWSDTYTYFEANTSSAEKGQPVSIKLSKLGYDENWETVVLPVENATITIDGNDTEYKTDAEGTVEIIFENTGSFVMSATAEYTIAPPICIITVAENDGTETVPPNSEKEDAETPDTPPTKEEIDYNVACNTILENIAGTYKDTVSDWNAFPEWYVMDFVAIIVKSLGIEFTGENVFSDVANDSWYVDFVRTAYHYEVIKGVSDTQFNPEGTITKEEAAVIIMRAAKLCGKAKPYGENAVRDILAGFVDYVKSSDWAREALAFCYDNGILPDSDIEIAPKTAVTRGEIVSMLYNMLLSAKLL